MKKTPAQTCETDLLVHIAQGEESALGDLYDRLGPWVYTIAHGILRNSADAEEVTQEVFLKIWHHAQKYTEKRGSVRAWLAVMTRNLAVDRFRSRHNAEGRRSVSDDGFLSRVSDASTSHESASPVERISIAEALQQLAEQHRQVLLLAYYDGFSHSEIADRLAIPLGTVKSRIRSGMDRLRDLLETE